MNKPLLVVLPYHGGDFEIAKKLLVWIAELGSCKPHSLLLCADSKIPQDQMRELMDIARPNFHLVTTMIVTVPTASNDMRVWAPNVMFLAAARQVHTNYKHDFLWLEPDAIPVHPGWLDDIAIEFARCPKRYLGSIIHQDNQPGLPADYLNGVAVYPNDAIELFDRITSVKTSEHAFDIGSAKYVVPKSLNTPLIRHYYGTKEMPPVFVEAKAPDSPKNHVTLDFVGEEAAIFHRSKDGNLIELLRSKRALIAAKEMEGVVIEVPMTPTVSNGDGTISKSPLRFDEHTSPQEAKKALEDLKTTVATPKKK